MNHSSVYFARDVRPARWGGPQLRAAAATAFQTLLGLAAQRLGVTREGLVASGVVVRDTGTGRRVTYEQLFAGTDVGVPGMVAAFVELHLLLQRGVTSVVWEQSSFHPTPRYSVLRFDEVPTIDVILIDRPEQPAWDVRRGMCRQPVPVVRQPEQQRPHRLDRRIQGIRRHGCEHGLRHLRGVERRPPCA